MNKNIGDMTNDELKDFIIELQEENSRYERKIEKAINKLDNFITCCKCEKLESGSDYIHNQYWNMFENFNKQVREILKGDE